MILCCGEALIDMLPRVTAQGETAFAPYPGGAVFNTAVALGRLGAPAAFFSGLSTDLFGDMLRASLAASRVDVSLTHISDRPTTLAFVRLVDGQAEYQFHDEGSAGRRRADAALPASVDPAAALLFGGISLIPEPCGSAYEALMRREQAKRVTMLDPNIRPAFISDPAAHRARIERMAAMSDIVKFSDEDLAWFGDAAPDEAAKTWLAKGPKLVLVTQGARGAVAYTARECVTMPARTVEIVDTVGAGDTFNAGVLASLWEQGLLTKSAIAALTPDQIAAALDLGIRAAAITVSRAGANPPWREEL